MPNFGRDFKFSQRRSVNWHLAAHADEILLAFLLETGKVIDTADEEGRTMLSWVVEKRNLVLIQPLLKYAARAALNHTQVACVLQDDGAKLR